MEFTGYGAWEQRDPLFEDKKNSRRIEHSQELEDLRHVMADPAGFRFLVGLLKGMAAGGYLTCDAEMIALRNEAESLIRRLIEANAGNALRIIAAIRGIEL